MIWKRLFSKNSCTDRGTLFQLKQLLHRSSVPTDPGDNMKAAEDFLLVVPHSYILAAANFILSSEPRPGNVAILSRKIIDKFVLVSILCSNPPNIDNKKADKVCVYAMELLTLGLLWHDFHDSSKEADGDRLVRVWKFNLILFKAARRKNYAIEALNLILQVDYFLSPREAAQVKWCRCINNTNLPGRNIPMDLYLEHLNKRLKTALRNVGSNITDNSVQLAAQSVAVIEHMCQQFQAVTANNKYPSNKNSSPSFDTDCKIILNVLQQQEVFVQKDSRQYSTFKFHKSLFQQMSFTNMAKWIKQTTKTLL